MQKKELKKGVFFQILDNLFDLKSDFYSLVVSNYFNTIFNVI